MSRWLPALILLMAGAPLAVARDAVSAIDACIARLDPGLDVGYQRVALRCPDLTTSLGAAPAAAWLPRDWNQSGNELSAGGLTELRTLLRRDVHPAADARPLRIGRVAPLLAGLARPEPPPGGWWARFKHWLREVFTRRAQRDDPGWLRRLFGDAGLSQAVQNAIVWATLATVVLLAGAIIVNELRVAGLLAPARRRPAALAAAAVGERPDASDEELEHASPAQQPRLLLELIAARLAAQDRLPPAHALTVQELARAARLPDAADRGRLALLGAVCERLRFSGREIPPPELADALAQGRALLAALHAPPRPAQAA